MGINKKLKSLYYLFEKQDDVLWKNEIEANQLVSSTLSASCIILLIVWVICYLGLFGSAEDILLSMISQSVVDLAIPVFLCRFFNVQKSWVKYVLLFFVTAVLARLNCYLNFNVVLVMVIPVVLSCRYFNKEFTVTIAILTAVFFGMSLFANAYYDFGWFDLNYYQIPAGTTLTIGKSLSESIRSLGIDVNNRVYQTMIYNFLPKLFVYFIISSVCVRIAETGKSLVTSQKIITEKTARIESELNLAQNIQAHMLPSIFPAFPEDEEFDIYASMEPAKEVGGDFYDFYKLDETHIGLVIADVSGKGIPAALFMVIAKTIIKNEIHMGYSPAEALSRVNHMLCEGNEDGMFVTAWVGIFDSKTGELTFSSAGHNPPLVLRDGKYSYLKMRSGFVLAGIDGFKYHQETIYLKPGDKLFLYTDGVTEAIDGHENMYGEQNLLDFMNAHKELGPKDMIKSVRDDVRTFANGADQFDDITMLMLDFIREKHVLEMKEKELNISKDTVDDMNAYLESELEQVDCPMKYVQQILICAEEIYVNVCNYAYPNGAGTMLLRTSITKDRAIVQFKDQGIPFNPLEKKDPDITLELEKRKEGGLGIFLVKKMMDEVKYVYQNGNNVLTIEKRFDDGCSR